MGIQQCIKNTLIPFFNWKLDGIVPYLEQKPKRYLAEHRGQRNTKQQPSFGLPSSLTLKKPGSACSGNCKGNEKHPNQTQNKNPSK